MVAEALGRKWACIELSSEYIRGGIGRFQRDVAAAGRGRPALYSINTPCSQPIDETTVPLMANGGATR
jgi:site-specific DNA-methyltransferase (cytosine-N4-specific)